MRWPVHYRHYPPPKLVNFRSASTIDAVAQQTRVIAPVPKPKAKNKATDEAAQTKAATDVEAVPDEVVDPHQRKPGDSPAVGDWRERMATDEAKALYKERAATAECVNAQARNRGLVLLPVRGLKKVKAVALLFALAHNLMCMLRLAPELIGIGTGTSRMAEMAG